ncbi:MAG: hypothetical protein GF416_00410 [Candidatus Altiarchaeales archaeon]|nr:hypothetical protein [Candidatus Altiarchaeales archaeon]MBD3415582.1 hypothetical protein [Candidatus Altiarchaeales archaeon]
MSISRLEWKHFFSLLKVLILLLTVRYLIQYALDYDIPKLINQSSAEYLAVAFTLLLVNYFLQIRLLMIFSRGKLTFMDSFYVEFYTMLMNTSIMSSFFSVQKIAFLNQRIKNLRESMQLFIKPMAFGVCIRMAFILVSGVGAYQGIAAAIIASAGLAGFFLIMVYGPKRRYVERVTGLPAKKTIQVGAIISSEISLISIAFFCILASLTDSDLHVFNVVFSEGVGYMSGFFSPLPSGLGVREFVLTELNSVMGISKEVAFAAAILYRFVIFADQVLAGVLLILSTKAFKRLRKPGVKGMVRS